MPSQSQEMPQRRFRGCSHLRLWENSQHEKTQWCYWSHDWTENKWAQCSKANIAKGSWRAIQVHGYARIGEEVFTDSPGRGGSG